MDIVDCVDRMPVGTEVVVAEDKAGQGVQRVHH